jgi:hypothetical protein
MKLSPALAYRAASPWAMEFDLFGRLADLVAAHAAGERVDAETVAALVAPDILDLLETEPSSIAAETRTNRFGGNDPKAAKYLRTTPLSFVGNQNRTSGKRVDISTMLIRCCMLCRSPLSCHLKNGCLVFPIKIVIASTQ